MRSDRVGYRGGRSEGMVGEPISMCVVCPRGGSVKAAWRVISTCETRE